MSDAVRRAGRASLANGIEIVWSVADGRRGRRWRAVSRREGSVGSSLLLEVGPDGRPVRLELATPTGLLTLHPEPTGLLHGNAVTGDGVSHLTLAWSDDHELEVAPLPISRAITARRLAGSVAVGEGTVVAVVAVDGSFAVHGGTRRYDRLDATTWRIAGDAETQRLTVDDAGCRAGRRRQGNRPRQGSGRWSSIHRADGRFVDKVWTTGVLTDAWRRKSLISP